MKKTSNQYSKWFILKNFGIVNLFKIIPERFFSINHLYVAKLNLKKLNPDLSYPKPQGTLGLIQPEDFSWIRTHLHDLNSQDKRDLLSRIHFYNNGFHGCYVIKIDDEITCLQWLIEPGENSVIDRHYKRVFYRLHDKEVIMDNVFTFPQYRGRGYMTFISKSLLKIAIEKGYTTAVTYIRKDKISTLNEILSMGFKLTRLLREIKFLGFSLRNL